MENSDRYKTKTFDEVKLWLSENEVTYKSLEKIIKMPCEHCLNKDKSKVCIRSQYKAEFDFHDLYHRTNVLIRYLSTSPDIGPLLKIYEVANLDDEKKYNEWINVLEEFWAERYLDGNIEKMLVKNDIGGAVGFKVIYSRLFEEDQYYIPIKGFENLLIFNELYKKFIASETVTLPPQLLLVDKITLN